MPAWDALCPTFYVSQIMAVFWFNPTFLSSLSISLVQPKPNLTDYKTVELLEALPVSLVQKILPCPRDMATPVMNYVLFH